MAKNHDDQPNPAIAILGGGPSGLLLARYLTIHAPNINYKVFEKGPRDNCDATQHGTCDMHAALGIQAIKEANLYSEFEAVACFDTQSMGMFDHTGAVITKNELQTPQVDVVALREMLVRSVPEERVEWGCEVENVRKDDASGDVVIRFKDGREERGFKLVVGADGTFSKARHLVTPATPHYFNITYLRTSISPASRFWSTAVGSVASNTYVGFGLRKQLLAQKNLCTHSYTVYAGIMLPETWADARISNPDAFREYLLKEQFGRWGSGGVNFLRYSDGPFSIWRHYVMSPSSLSWTSVPGVALVGDAAHPTLPWPSESLSNVLFDSLELGREIAKFGLEGLDNAVREYERKMFPRRKALSEKCQRLGEFLFDKDAEAICEVLLAAGGEGL